MKKNQIKRMSNHEFCCTVSRVIRNSRGEGTTISSSTSPDGDSEEKTYRTFLSVINALSQDIVYSRGINQKDSSRNTVCFQYYLFKDVEIFGIIQKESTAEVNSTYILFGEPEQVDKYRRKISSVACEITNLFFCSPTG